MSVTVFNPRINDAAVAETTATAPAVTALKEASSAQAPVEKAVTKKVFVTTQGCQMNVYDSGKML
ncbi:MAG: tRNA (N6-isopentenyl adenosine(37)-C2)-methylthiotransferase MiaB, partial [Psychrobacter sp.]